MRYFSFSLVSMSRLCWRLSRCILNWSLSSVIFLLSFSVWSNFFLKVAFSSEISLKFGLKMECLINTIPSIFFLNFLEYFSYLRRYSQSSSMLYCQRFSKSSSKSLKYGIFLFKKRIHYPVVGIFNLGLAFGLFFGVEVCYLLR